MTKEHTFRLRQNLTSLLKDRRITAAQLSKTTGIAKQVLSDWMSGGRPRHLEQLFVVSKILNVTLEALCFSESPLLAVTPFSQPGQNHTWTGDELRGQYEVYLRRIKD
jgi:transcriptional regulator with XRE-family HTH domain